MAENLQALTAGSADMNTVGTPDGIYRYVSLASRRLFGWDPAKVEGHHQDEFVHPDDLAAFRTAMGSLVDEDGIVVATYRFRCADDSYHWTEATARRMGVDWEEFKKAAAERTPVRRTGKPIDIANVIAFLCHDDSSFVSGQIIYVAGGPRV